MHFVEKSDITKTRNLKNTKIKKILAASCVGFAVHGLFRGFVLS